MKRASASTLAKLLAVLRDHGVTEYADGALTLKLQPKPQPATKPAVDDEDDYARELTGRRHAVNDLG